MSNFRPLHDRVVLRRITAAEKTAGGIIIPDTAQEKPAEAVVVAVGPGTRDEHGQYVALEVREGDHVLFGRWSGTEVRIGEEDFLIAKESDLFGVIAER
ncbi:co-chaperone GroES [Acetobacter sp. DsW_063]|uniref:co-chaperone GroES n=1 Tax=Acetobacter sp. DsW_063 TaxID=1514894 RepID=UPI000A3705E1|nr:co-chaperone GroES [Acetobacter sp. DsW_063]OUJ13675.1 molecular chaperone GroES [Acetobacter sp. DsW_063]